MIPTILAALAVQAAAPPALPPVRPDPVPSVLIVEMGEGWAGLAETEEGGRLIASDRGGVRNKPIAYEGEDPRYALFSEAIDAAPETVRRGYAQSVFPFGGQRWREVLACRAPDGLLGEAAPERVCFACSIDDIGGTRFGEEKAPPTAVSIRAAYAFFRRDDRGRWALRRYEPFGGNRYARNGNHYHRAATRWIAEQAVGECYDLQAVSGSLNIY